MASYTRQSSFADGDTITAALFNNEFNQVVNAFHNSTGHKHDGTTAEGPVIGVLGDAGETSPNNKVLIDTTNNFIEFYVQVSSSPVQQLYIADGAIIPVTDNDIDLGTSSLEFKDAYFDGTVTSDAFAGPLTGDVTGNVSGTAATVTTAAQSNITSLGTLTTLTVDNVIINGTTIGHTSDTDLLTLTSGVLTVAGEVDATSLDISGDADIDGTLEADAITIGGVTLAETISDTVGAMVSSNTETNITVTYEDSDNTLDFVIGTLNQDTTGLAGTATALATARTIHGVSFDGTANIDLTEVVQDTVGAMVSSNTESGITVAYQDGDGTLDFTVGTLNQDTTGTAATVTTAAQPNITSLGTLTTLTVDNVIINGTTIGHTSDTDLITLADGNVTIAGELDLTTLDVSGDADIDGTLEADAITIGGVTLAETIADTVGAMVSSNTESGITVAYQDADNTLDFTVGTLNQNTTGSAATLTTARTIGGVSFNGSANIDLPGVNSAGNQNTSGTAAIATTVTITDNESTNETNAVVFTAGGDVDGGNLGLESDGNLTYNPSSGTLAATAFTGALTGNVTGNASGTAATVTGGTQASITAAANLVTVGTIGTGVWQGTAIASAYIAADAITGAKIADDAIDSEHYTDGSIDTAHIADDQVTGAKIENAVTIATSATSPLMVATTSARITQVAISSSSNATAWDATAAANAYYVTSENTTISAPSNAVEGAIISIEIAQGGTARTVAWNTVFEFAASTAPTVTATASKTDIFAFRYNGSVWQEIGRVQNMAQT